jgi:hypothetical protein
MLGEVHKWTMTEEEGLAFIANHPIKPLEKPREKDDNFTNIYDMKRKERIKGFLRRGV